MLKESKYPSYPNMYTDPVLQSLIQKYPAPHFEDRTDRLFEDLIESVISQQLSIKASDTIYKRFKTLFAHPTFPTPHEVLEIDQQAMRACGISFQKISYIKSIADAFLNDLINTKKMKEMRDEEIITSLTQIRGVGKWTAEMILIFTLKRPDVFSIGDLGIRNAIKNLYGISDQKEMLILSEKWKPNRSTACWYLWRSLENK